MKDARAAARHNQLVKRASVLGLTLQEYLERHPPYIDGVSTHRETVMAFFSGTIYKGDGTVCCEKAVVSLEAVRRDQGPWYGTVSADHMIDMLAGEKYKLVLSDGRSAEIMVRRNTSAGGENRAIAIQGMSPLK